MRNLVLPGLGALVLASCAPSLTATSSRIVNISTGEEGQVSFDRRPITPGSGSVVVRFGRDTLSGTYNVLSGGTISPRLGFGLGFAFGGGSFYGPRASVEAAYDPFSGYRGYENNSPRSGNFIVRGAGGRTISCDFLTDAYGRGNGNCTDGRGQRYTLQF